MQKQTAGGEIAAITTTDTDHWSVSPDERLIAVICKDEQTKKYPVQIRNLETGKVLKTFDFNLARQLSWTRDGKAPAYISPKQEMDELVFQPLDETPAKILSATRGERITSFDWNFDGSKLIVVRSKFTADAVLIKAYTK